MSQMHQVIDSEEAPAGMMCGSLDSGSGSSGTGDHASEFWMKESTSEDGLHMSVGSYDETLAKRFYDRNFLESRRVDRFTVTTQSGDTYAFMYWGGDRCEDCPPLEFEALPGDPWGCGTSPRPR
jgi:hypothetical protein